MKTRKHIYRSLIVFTLLIFAATSFAQDCTFGIFKISTQDTTASVTVETFPSAYPEVMKIKNITVETPAVMVLADIKKTEVQGDRIILHFTYKGAKKWARFTEESIGKQIAMLVNNKVYCMPKVNAKILGGMAMINGLRDAEEAASLNKYLSKK